MSENDKSKEANAQSAAELSATLIVACREHKESVAVMALANCLGAILEPYDDEVIENSYKMFTQQMRDTVKTFRFLRSGDLK